MTKTTYPLTEARLLLDETLLSTANGYIGVRGNFEEGYSKDTASVRGTYLNGFYEEVDVTYGENAYGFPQTAQKLVNVIDAQTIELWIDGDKFNVYEGTVTKLLRRLDIEAGYAEREVHWTSPKGHQLVITIRRMTSFEKLELMLIDYRVKSINFTGKIRIESTLNGDVENYTNAHDPRVASGHSKLLRVSHIQSEEDVAVMTARTFRSELSHTAAVAYSLPVQSETEGNCVRATYKGRLKKNQSIRFVKYIIYTDSIRHGHATAIAKSYVKEASSHGADELYRAQKDYLTRFWQASKVEVFGDPSTQEALDYSIYQLLASSGKDGYSNIAAKGLSGEGYEGHYFWDTEIYMLPFFTLTNRDLAKELMQFRHTTLDASRARAKELGHRKGAKVAWRTISGSECSGYFPAGTAQYHINADVAYSYLQYYWLTGDLEFMVEYGAEVLVETARLWLDTGNYDREGRFLINDVTGPDEYSAIVNNNWYTNAMAAYHLNGTVKVLMDIEEAVPTKYKQIKDGLGLRDREVMEMDHASSHMYLPYDKSLGIDVQDDGFLQKAAWDFERTPKSNYPLLLHYHPLTIYRHKVLKQADTVLAHLLLDNREEDILRRSYDYYESYTTHDSSLSPCVYSMMAARTGQVEKAYDYFVKTLRLDIDNLHGNTKDGLHIANAGGAYMSMVYGFGGLRIKPDEVCIRPVLPKAWEGYSFRFEMAGTQIKVEVSDQIKVEASSEVKLRIYDDLHVIKGRFVCALR